MEINFTRVNSTFLRHMPRNTIRNIGSLLDKLNSTGNYTQIGNLITLNDGTSFHTSEIPKINIKSLDTITAQNNIIDFGSSRYFKYITSEGKEFAIFSMPRGGICRPVSESIIGVSKFDKETERYLAFWNNLKTGHASFRLPGNQDLPDFGYSNDDIRNYLNKSGITKGFFTVKMGNNTSEFFYSDSEQNPLFRREDYDLRYYTMTSPDFSYEKSVFSCLEPGTKITIDGKEYTLKDDLTLDIPYGIDIFNIQIPKHNHVNKTLNPIDYKI